MNGNAAAAAQLRPIFENNKNKKGSLESTFEFDDSKCIFGWEEKMPPRRHQYLILQGKTRGGKGLRERQREERRDKMMSVRLAVVLFTRLQNP